MVGLTSVAAIAAAAAACAHDLPTAPPPNFHGSLQIASPQVWGTLNGLDITGGYGSAVAVDPNDQSTFYIMTDRGPNVMTPTPNNLIFILPDFHPTIGKFRIVDSSLKLISQIPLRTKAGALLSGLPNPPGEGATGEVALDPNLAPLGTDPEGIDSEGLALAADGSFWVSDEYGPHIVHFDRNGRTIERINPFGSGTGGRKIPLVFAKRRANRGMEGIAITPDQKTVLGAMQSPLDNPTAAIGRASNINRLVFFDIKSGKVKEFVYQTELVGNYISDIVALTNTTFLVDERDANFPEASNPGFKRVYKIDISKATDVTDPANGATGKLWDGKALEQLTTTDFTTYKIKPVTKSLVFDLATQIPGGYAPDKFEGLTIIGNDLLAMTNDDDFGVLDDGNSGIMAKILPLTGKRDVMTMYFARLPRPIR